MTRSSDFEPREGEEARRVMGKERDRIKSSGWAGNLSADSEDMERDSAFIDVSESAAAMPSSGGDEPFRAYPIFDRDGKVARMIGVGNPLNRIAADHRGEGSGVPPGESPDRTPVSFCGMVGASAQMKALFQLIRRVAASNATILIYGESGTGKELVARAIHQCSHRRAGEFIPVNCGALTDTLLESELFGHVKGAFTGAMYRKKGLFEAATGGTLFLDEISNTSPAFQSKLLRALQEGEVRAVGGTRTVRVNVRVVAATNTSLKDAIAKKTFREDLYYRLAVVPIRVPPLRERPEDILPLSRYFIGKFGAQTGKRAMRLSSDAAELLCRFPWNGNVRELENVLERAVLIAPGTVITPDAIVTEEEEFGEVRSSAGWSPAAGDASSGQSGVTLDAARSRAERDRIIDAIRKQQGNKSLAARSLGISRASLYNKLKRYDIGPSDLGYPGA